MYWSPRVKICFTDEELVQNLVLTHDRPERRAGNWWTFFSHLCRPERDRLEREASRRWSASFMPHPNAYPDDYPMAVDEPTTRDPAVRFDHEVAEPAGPEIIWQR